MALDLELKSTNIGGMRTVTELIEACGGPEKIEAAAGPNLEKPDKPRLSHWAIRKWPQNGIPEWHWPLLMSLLPGTTAEELHAANEAVRAMPPSREASAA